jgi:nanoRNase/pAp phosphatase (c-di-AMP/oligoRNAs hydrolase)
MNDRKYIVVFDDQNGLLIPMQFDPDCIGALTGFRRGDVALFDSRADARKAIRISAALAKLFRAQGKPANDDFLEDIKHVRIVGCAKAEGGAA